jgi:hypothetical protein
VSFEGFRWITVSPPSQPGLEIGLVTPNDNPGASTADREAAASLLAKGLPGGVIFATDDCDARFEAIRASGAEVLQEPIDQPYGVRDCAFRDPAGNMLRFSQPPSLTAPAPAAAWPGDGVCVAVCLHTHIQASLCLLHAVAGNSAASAGSSGR